MNKEGVYKIRKKKIVVKLDNLHKKSETVVLDATRRDFHVSLIQNRENSRELKN
jgi:hypothetical protein